MGLSKNNNKADGFFAHHSITNVHSPKLKTMVTWYEVQHDKTIEHKLLKQS